MIENLADLKTPRAKRIFVFCSTLLVLLEIVLLIFFQYHHNWIRDPFPGLIQEVLNHLIGASITGFFIAALLIFLLPIEERPKSVEFVDPTLTKKLHDMAVSKTDFWYHHGHTGRWVRNVAMPILAKASVEKGISTSIKLIILDPTDVTVCSLYAEYRNRIAFKENHIRTLRHVQAELLATIVLAQCFDQNPDGLHVEVFLTNQLSLVREDIASTIVFRTQVDPRSPALVFYNINGDHEKAELYNTAKTNFDYAARCCTKRVIARHFPDGPISSEKVKAYLQLMGLVIYQDSGFLNDVLNRVRSNSHPYN